MRHKGSTTISATADIAPQEMSDVLNGELLDESKGYPTGVYDGHKIGCRYGKRGVSEKSPPVMTESR